MMQMNDQVQTSYSNVRKPNCSQNSLRREFCSCLEVKYDPSKFSFFLNHNIDYCKLISNSKNSISNDDETRNSSFYI
jgi:hypothetical protein